MKNIANADRPKSAAAMLPPRPLRGSGKVAQTAFKSERRDGKSCIPTLIRLLLIHESGKFQNFVLLELLTVSEKGRQARGVMLGLAKTCAKLKIRFFDYLGARLGIPGPQIPNLANLVREAPS
jgi:hypothetical protein